MILKKYLVSCLLGFLSFGVHLAVLSFSCATEGPTSVIPQWQKGKCESESTLGDTRRGYSVNCTPARLTLLREECRRGFACMIRYAAEIILLTVVLGRISYTAAITPSRYSSGFLKTVYFCVNRVKDEKDLKNTIWKTRFINTILNFETI